MKRRRSSASTPARKKRRYNAAPASYPVLAAPKGTEKKWTDTVVLKDSAPAATYLINGANASNDPFKLLNGLALGTSANQRIGRRITMRSILLRFNFYPQATTTLAGRFRIVVFYDRQTNGTTPIGTDLLQNNLSMYPLNLSNADRFLVLYDKYSPVMGSLTGGAAGTAAPFSTIKLYRKLKLDTTYGLSAASDVTAVATGGLFLGVWQVGFATANPNYDCHIRVRYTDD